MRPSKHSVREGERAYRRGFLVGVTLAEVCILLVFILLLLAAAERQRRASAAAALAELQSGMDALKNSAAELIPVSEVERLRLRDQIVERLQHASGVDLEDRDSFDVLVRELAKRTTDFEKYKENVRARLEHLSTLDADELAREMVNQTRQIEILEAQKSELLGRGLVFPSCIPAGGGRTSFVYDLRLSEEGILGRSTEVAASFSARNNLAIPALNPDERLGGEEFIARTRALFSWSAERDCRFVVRVVDETGSNSKVRYKELLRAVEVNFYKYLSEDRASLD